MAVLNVQSSQSSQELCESRGGRPGPPVPHKPTVSVDVKQHFNNKLSPTRPRPTWKACLRSPGQFSLNIKTAGYLRPHFRRRRSAAEAHPLLIFLFLQLRSDGSRSIRWYSHRAIKTNLILSQWQFPLPFSTGRNSSQ